MSADSILEPLTLSAQMIQIACERWGTEDRRQSILTDPQPDLGEIGNTSPGMIEMLKNREHLLEIKSEVCLCGC